MRLTVLSGIFVCTLIFVTNGQSASALPLEKLQIQNNTTSVDVLLAVTDTTTPDSLEGEVPTPVPEPVTHATVNNESLSDIAKVYETTWKRLYDKNTQIVNPDIISSGDIITIPTQDEVVEPRELPITVKPLQNTRRSKTNTVASASSRTLTASSPGNRYAAGNCTWYVKSLRADLPNNLGNANTWAARAAAQGYSTGSTPRVGAAAQAVRGTHIAYVTAVNNDGTITITEMNRRNLYEVTSRTVAASSFAYIY